MKNIKRYKYMLAALSLLLVISCNEDWLEREPRHILIDDQVWNDPKQIVGLLANYYDRLVTETGLEDIDHTSIDTDQERQMQWRNMADYDDAMWSGQSNEDGRNNIAEYGIGRWRVWNYSLIRHINIAIDKINTASEDLSEAQKTQFTAELRFLRAFSFFQMAIRMGGIPLVTEPLDFDFSDDVTPLQHPRATEAETYEFIADEMDAIKDVIGNEGSVTRANKYTALALKSRAMLYAASLAKYNSARPNPIALPGGEVGIPAGKADEYYTASLNASKEIIEQGPYELYKANEHLGENFYEATTKKANNTEVIFVKDFLASKDRRHFFAYDNVARGAREDNLASSTITPSLNLVESFEYLDGSDRALKTRTVDNSDYIYYDNLTEIFEGKDARLYGTVVYPGSTFRGVLIDMQAGVKTWNGTGYTTTEGELAQTHSDGLLLTSASGPHRNTQEVSNTGFYMRKFIQNDAGATTRGIRSDNWWIWFRLSEIYLNAAEAAWELGLPEAAGYINEVRERAGFGENSLAEGDLTLDRFVNERRVEFAFEDHRVFDLKRWRLADQVWNGNPSNPDAMVYALYPYRVIRPDDPSRNGKYVFEKMVAPRFRAPRLFRERNYYSEIHQSVINNNPKIVRNPFH